MDGQGSGGPGEARDALAAMRRLLDRAMARGEPGRLPAVPGLPAPVLARALYRAWLGETGRWGPFVHLDGRLMGSGAPSLLADALRQARDGWLFVSPPPPHLNMAALARQLHEVGGRLVVPDPSVTTDVDDDTMAQILRDEGFHLVATDPALADVRRSLLSHCRSASIVHLSGPSGTGKRFLGRWAHACLDDRPLSEVARDGDPRPLPGQWMLFDEVSELDPDRIHHLRAQLEDGSTPVGSTAGEAARGVERPDVTVFAPIRGHAPALVRVLDRAARAARSPLPVLVLGESGVGKELFARALHELSGRKGPFHAVDVSTLNPSLVESELFGHEEGAFSGATSSRKGAVRTAEGGTLFLDELGNLEPKTQAKLLRLLQEHTVQPVGSDRVMRVDVRFVAATNADLEAMVRRGEFREDLLRRLEAITLHIPPLRARGGDVLELASGFFAEARGLPAAPAGWVSPEASAILAHHTWPGNVRELKQVVQVAAWECDDGPVLPEHLGPLAPANRRPVPLITTQSIEERGEPPNWPLPRSVCQRMTTVTMRVPALSDRSEASVRHAVLWALGGHPIHLEALDALARRIWSGNLPELIAAVRALTRSSDGPIDLLTVRRHLPHLLVSTTGKPIHVLWNPVLDDGDVTGLERTFRVRSLLVGRVRSIGQLEETARAESPSGTGKLWDQLAAIRRLASDTPACLPFSHLSRLSRAHVLVTLDDDGFQVHGLPGVASAAWAGSLEPGAPPPLPVRAGQSDRMGEAFELQLRDEAGHRQLQLFLFAGPVARADFGRASIGRASGDAAPSDAKQTGLLHLGDLMQIEAERPKAPWTLDPAEMRAINEVVSRYEGGAFSAHLRRELAAARADERLAAVVGFVLDVRPTQYCALLYEHEGNTSLRRDLLERMEARGLGRAWLATLPLGIRRAVEAERQTYI